MKDFLWVNLCNVLILGCASGQILLPVYLEQSSVTRWEIGLIYASFALAAVAVRFRLGHWLQRYGQIGFYRGGALTVALCELSYSWVTPSAGVMLVLRSLEGVALASYFTAIWSRVIDSAPPDRLSRITGLFGISGLFAGAVGPWALERVAQASDFPTAFRLGGCMGLLGVMLCLWVRELPSQPSSLHPDRSFWQVVESRPMRSVVLAAWLFGLTLGSFNTFIAPYLAWLKLGRVGPMFLLYTLASITVRLGFGGMADRWHPRAVIYPSLLLFSAGLGLLGLLQDYPLYGLFLLAGALVGSAHGLIYPAISTLALRRSASSSNTASSAFTACMDAGSLLGCCLSGVSAHFFGYAQTFAGLAVVLLLGCWSVYRAERGQ